MDAIEPSSARPMRNLGRRALILARPMNHQALLAELGLGADNPGAYNGSWIDTSGDALISTNPATGKEIARVRDADLPDYDRVMAGAREAFLRWRAVPAPVRGEYVRKIGERLREKKDALGAIVSLECGKILEEGKGEIQECIDIADFAVGLSRQLYGLTIASERPLHHMRETWQPLGTVGIITAFNFPAAVWAWNAMLSLVCGNAHVWKPSRKAPLTALAMTKVCAEVLEEDGWGGLIGLVVGTDETVGNAMLDDGRLPLISATGSVRMGKIVGSRVAARLGKTILELGGNNAVTVLEDADLDMATRAIVFGAVGTCRPALHLDPPRAHATNRSPRISIAKLAGPPGQGGTSTVKRIGDPLASRHADGPADRRGRGASSCEKALDRGEGAGGRDRLPGAAVSTPPR
jgi:aldehyde dehydrogenase (NAD+)